MKKDFIHVLVTFSLIGTMVIGGSYFYNKKVYAEKISTEIADDQYKKQLEEQVAQKQFELEAKQKRADEILLQTELLQNQQAQNKITAEQKAQVLANQQADAQLAQEQLRIQNELLTQQQAQISANRISRTSRAS